MRQQIQMLERRIRHTATMRLVVLLGVLFGVLIIATLIVMGGR